MHGILYFCATYTPLKNPTSKFANFIIYYSNLLLNIYMYGKFIYNMTITALNGLATTVFACSFAIFIERKTLEMMSTSNLFKKNS